MCESIKGSQREMSLPYSECKHSEVTDAYWIYAIRKEGKYPKITQRSGKWLIFVDSKNVDEVWAKIKEANLKINKIYFPSELEKYPGSLNFVFELFNNKKLAEEKLRLLEEQLKKRNQKSDIYVFINADPMRDAC